MGQPFLARDALRQRARADHRADPGRSGTIEIAFDLLDHEVIGTASDGSRAAIPLGPMSVAEFHARFVEMVASLGGTPEFHGRPNEVPDPVPFRDDRQARPYDADAVARFFQALVAIAQVFQRFRTGLSARSARCICSGAVSTLL